MNSICGEQGHHYNRLLVKDRLGKPRAATCKLPPSDYTFGKPAPRQGEGVKEAVTQWVSRNAAAPSDKPFEKSHDDVVHGAIIDRPSTPFKAIVENAYCHDPDRHERKYPQRTASTTKQSGGKTQKKSTGTTTLAQELRTISMFEKAREHEDAKEAGVNKMQDGWKMRKFEGVGRRVDSCKHANHSAYKALKDRTRGKETTKASPES